LIKKRFLVTGGLGFIGSNLIRKLSLLKNIHICNIDKISYSSSKESLKDINTKNYSFEKINIANQIKVKEIIDNFRPDCVIHLAAESHVDRSIDDPSEFIKSNIVGTYTLLNESYQYWKSLKNSKKINFRFINVSTDEVYGSLSKNESSFTEESNYNPNSPYSASKASSDHLARSWHKTYSFPVITTNTCNNYGPWQFPEKLIPLVINKCINGKSIPVYGKGNQIRDWIRVEDHIDGLFKVIEKGKIGEKYNIGANCELSNIKVVKNICDYLDKVRPLKGKSYRRLIKYVKDRPGHDNRYAIDNKKILKLGWRPKYNWQHGISETIDWYLENYNFLESKTKKIYSGERLGRL
jgi:dTDP-glucose 4,6-dehydratase